VNRCLKNTEFIRKELSSIIKNNSSTRRYSQISLSADVSSVRASATFMSHPFPFSLAASQTHCAGRDCCWRRAPVTGVNKRETTLSKILTVQVLILICQHRLPAPLTVLLITKGDVRGAWASKKQVGILKSSYGGKVFLRIFKLVWLKSKQIFLQFSRAFGIPQIIFVFH
jgi:hypothetical protein